MSEGKVLGLKLFIIVAAAIFNAAFGIAALVIFSQYKDDIPVCAQISTFRAGILNQVQWLEGFGIASIIIFAITVPLAATFDKSPQGLYGWSAVSGLFSFAWMVVGSVLLFQYNFYCQNSAFSLWAMSLAALISYYVAMGFNCLIVPCVRAALAD